MHCLADAIGPDAVGWDVDDIGRVEVPIDNFIGFGVDHIDEDAGFVVVVGNLFFHDATFMRGFGDLIGIGAMTKVIIVMIGDGPVLNQNQISDGQVGLLFAVLDTISLELGFDRSLDHGMHLAHMGLTGCGAEFLGIRVAADQIGGLVGVDRT